MRDFHLPGRSPVHSLNGMAATSHPAATLAAIDVLRAGGNAVDAAITAAAVLAVIEPTENGIGGDCFALYAPRGKNEIVALNGSGCAPAAATLDWFREHGISEISPDSAHSVTVPGSVAAWARLHADYGAKLWKDVLSPAIEFAERGYPVHSRIAWDWTRNAGRVAANKTASRIYLPGSRAPATAEVHRQPQLAATLKEIARQGRDGFYKGPVAKDIVDTLRGLGGLHSLEDFELQQAEYVTPVKTRYRGYDVHQCPPNGMGMAVLLMLNILEGFPLSKLDPGGAERLHLMGEATRLAFHTCHSVIGDPAQVQIPVEEILSPDFAARLRKQISRDFAMADARLAVPVHPDTIYVTVVDKDRNAISFINSLFYTFGSSLVSADTGVLLQNRGLGFVMQPGHPNCIAPRKRPLHTIIPAMVTKAGRAVMPFGVMGGQYQPVGQCAVLSNFLDYGMDLQEAIDYPRAFRAQTGYQLERGIRAETANALGSMGHTIERIEAPLGGGQAIWIDWESGVLTGASDPRKDGCALGY